MRKSNRGFTVIELLLVTAIISVILMLTAPALMTVRRKALILACQSNMHQIHLMIETYRLHNDDIVPYLLYVSEDMLDPEHVEDPQTDTSGLAAIVGENRSILRCPADNGYGGVDYGLTPSGLTCYSCFGESYAYNNSPYTDDKSPYDSLSPARFGYVGAKAQERVILLTDFCSVWHGVAGTNKQKAKYFLNIMYYSGRVEGKEFPSDQAAKSYRNDVSRRCWWQVAE